VGQQTLSQLPGNTGHRDRTRGHIHRLIG
jgi:hypothetical protein